VFLRGFSTCSKPRPFKICVSSRREAHFGPPGCSHEGQFSQCIVYFACFSRGSKLDANMNFVKCASRRGEKPILAGRALDNAAKHHGTLRFTGDPQLAAKRPCQGQPRRARGSTRFFRRSLENCSKMRPILDRYLRGFERFRRKTTIFVKINS